MTTGGMARPRGSVSYRKVQNQRPRGYWWWRVRNFFQHYYRSVWRYYLAKAVAKLGIPTITAELRVRVIRASGLIEDYGVVSRRVVTDDFVDDVVDSLQNSTTNPLDEYMYHASGTGSTAENQTDSGLVAEATTITDRATGSQVEGASTNIYKTVGTQTFTGSGSIVEHGVFDVITESIGTLMDRSVFASIGVNNSDQIEWTYSLTINAGG